MQPGDKRISFERSNTGKCQLAGPLGDNGYTHCGTMETATLAGFVQEARAVGWEPPRRGKLASLRKQLPGFDGGTYTAERESERAQGREQASERAGERASE